MREILFRGKRADNGEYMPGSYGDWVYGSYGLKLNVATGEHDEYIMESVYNGATNSSYFVDYKIIPGTAGQYTGMVDRNGKKIFEGDILKLTGSYEETDGSMQPYEEIHKIVYMGGCFYALNIKGFPYWPLLCEVVDGLHEGETYEIIGNIHDEGEDEND